MSRRRRTTRALAASLAVTAAVAGCGSGGSHEQKVQTLRLALDFDPNAVHAGIYTTTALGLDRRAGVRLRIIVPASSTDSLKLLAAGRADLGVLDIHDFGIARERGADLVAVGAIVQRPLAAVIARQRIRRPRQLQGKRVGVTGVPSDDAVLRAVVEADHGRVSRVHRTTIGFGAVPSLAAGRVAAVVTFWNDEGVALRARGIRTREFRVDRYGAPRYPELVLVAYRRTLIERGVPVARAVRALTAGTVIALHDRAAAARRIARVSNTRLSLVRAQLDAVAPALSPPLRLSRRAVEGWARFDVRFGILRRPPDVRAAFLLPAG